MRLRPQRRPRRDLPCRLRSGFGKYAVRLLLPSSCGWCSPARRTCAPPHRWSSSRSWPSPPLPAPPPGTFSPGPACRALCFCNTSAPPCRFCPPLPYASSLPHPAGQNNYGHFHVLRFIGTRVAAPSVRHRRCSTKRPRTSVPSLFLCKRLPPRGSCRTAPPSGGR